MKTKSMYTLDQEWYALEEALDENGGEFTPEIEETYAELLHASKEKAAGYIAVIQIASEEEKMYKSQEKRFKALAKTAGAKAKGLKDRLLSAMQLRGEPEYVTDVGKAKVTKNGGPLPMTLLVDPEDLPEQFRIRTVTYSADVDALRQALAEGDSAAAAVAQLEERGEHLRIR